MLISSVVFILSIVVFSEHAITFSLHHLTVLSHQRGSFENHAAKKFHDAKKSTQTLEVKPLSKASVIISLPCRKVNSHQPKGEILGTKSKTKLHVLIFKFNRFGFIGAFTC